MGDQPPDSREQEGGLGGRSESLESFVDVLDFSFGSQNCSPEEDEVQGVHHEDYDQVPPCCGHRSLYVSTYTETHI
jgi:hypothetical protein